MSLKASKYNILFDSEDGTTLAYNCSASGLAKMTPDKAAQVKEILAAPASYDFDCQEKIDLREKLLKGKFLLPEGDDELANLKVANRSDRFNSETLGLTIAPTMACNFRCRYCYEKAVPGVMAPEVEKALIKMVEQRIKSLRHLSVTWFGGEPLLAIKLIERLSKKFRALCKSNRCLYSAGIVTNGYLWDRRTAKKLKRLGVETVQITLDGPPQIHDQRRPLAGGQGSFARILANVKDTAGIIPINLRINTDRDNSGEVLQLLEIIKQNGLQNKVQLYFAKVEAYTEACANIGGSCYSSQEYSALEVDLCRQALDKGFAVSRYPRAANGGYCTADRLASFVIAPDGHMYKCWNQISEGSDQAVGHMLDKKIKPEHRINLYQWLSWDPFEKTECRECKILPICMGGCPYNARKEPSAEKGHCESWKYHLMDMLNLTYLGHKAGAVEKTTGSSRS